MSFRIQELRARSEAVAKEINHLEYMRWVLTELIDGVDHQPPNRPTPAYGALTTIQAAAIMARALLDNEIARLAEE